MADIGFTDQEKEVLREELDRGALTPDDLDEIIRRGALPPPESQPIRPGERPGTVPGLVPTVVPDATAAPGAAAAPGAPPELTPVGINVDPRPPGYGPIPDDQQRPSTLGEATGGWATRPAFEGAGALTGTAVGAILGAPFGAPGVARGSILGGPAGAYAGSVIYDSANNLLRDLEIFSGELATTWETFGNATRAAAWDAGSMGAIQALRPLLQLRKFTGRISGVGRQDAMALRHQASELGIGLGAVDVGGALPKGYAKVIGLFPFTGTPLRKALVKKMGQSVKWINDILDDLGPNALLRSEVGLDLAQAATKNFDNFRAHSGKLYQVFEDLVDKAVTTAGRPIALVPTSNTKALATALTKELQEAKVTLEVWPSTGVGPPRAKPLAVPHDAAVAFIRQLSDLPDLITLKQYRGLTQNFKTLLNQGKFSNVDIGRVTAAKEALETDLNLIRTDLAPGTLGVQIKNALSIANKYYSTQMQLYEGVAGKKFMTVDKLIFASGGKVPGSLNADELVAVFDTLKSPQAVRDLRALVGSDNLNHVAQQKIRSALELSMFDVKMGGESIPFINADKLAKNLGLLGRKGTREREAFTELLKDSGFKIEDLDRFVAVIKQIEGMADPAEFVKRRVLLGGIQAAVAMGGVGGALVTAGAGGGASVAIPLLIGTFLSRKASRAFATPEALKAMTDAMANNTPEPLRRRAVVRLLRMLREEEVPSAQEEVPSAQDGQEQPGFGAGGTRELAQPYQVPQ